LFEEEPERSLHDAAAVKRCRQEFPEPLEPRLKEGHVKGRVVAGELTDEERLPARGFPAKRRVLFQEELEAPSRLALAHRLSLPTVRSRLTVLEATNAFEAHLYLEPADLSEPIVERHGADLEDHVPDGVKPARLKIKDDKPL